MNGYLKEVIQLILRKETNKNGDKKNEVTVRNDRGQELIDKNENERDKEDEEMVKDKETDDSKVQVLCLPYVKGVSARSLNSQPWRLSTGDRESKKPSTSEKSR